MFTKKAILNKIGHIALHIIFWCVVLMFFTYFFGVGSKNYQETLMFSFFLMPITIATTYVSIYKLIPDYLITKRYLRFAIYTLYTLIISGYLIMVSVFFSLIYLSEFKYTNMNPLTRNIILVGTAVYIVVVLVSGFKLLKLNNKAITKTTSLETKILETQLKLKEQELNYLKMQIHPHFLFNTLNTMYGFALKKADETPEMILKLSNLLDYLLYQVDKTFVLLTDEIDHINDYIALEKLRFNDTLTIDFKTNCVPKDTKIAPMLLLPFIENSFKHGRLINGILNITIDLSCTNDNLFFTIKNTSSKQDKTANGIGLQNITKRLNMLYKDNYTLDFSNKIDTFKVTLQLTTN